jgi:RNA polymerase sigma-70 factor (ECF subfamily)
MTVFDRIVKKIPGRKKTADRFWELANVHVKFLYNMAWRYAGNKYDAEDLVQETYYIGFKKFGQLRDESKLKSWLFTILRNTYLKSRRQDIQSKKTDYDDSVEYISALENAAEKIDVATAYEQKIDSTRIQLLLAELPEKYKSPLLLYYMSEMSYQEISEILDLPMGTVMSRLSRGKQILKKRILRIHMLDSKTSKVIQFPKKNYNK